VFPPYLQITKTDSLTSGSFLLFFGKVADMFGRRGILLTSLFLFAVLALGTGFSRDALTLDVLNGVMGLTSASIIPSAQGILGSIYDKPSKRKNYAFACFTSGNHLGFVFSSIFSGIATQFFRWPASFWLLAIIYLIVAIIACFTVPVDDSEKLPLSIESLKQFDILGAALTVGGIGLFAAGIRYGCFSRYRIHPSSPRPRSVLALMHPKAGGLHTFLCSSYWVSR